MDLGKGSGGVMPSLCGEHPELCPAFRDHTCLAWIHKVPVVTPNFPTVSTSCPTLVQGQELGLVTVIQLGGSIYQFLWLKTDK